MWMHPKLAKQLAEEAIRDDYSGKPLVDRVAAAIMAAVEMEPDEHGIIGILPVGHRIQVRVDPSLGPNEWRLESPAPTLRVPPNLADRAKKLVG
jgi:hypothetical protein